MVGKIRTQTMNRLSRPLIQMTRQQGRRPLSKSSLFPIGMLLCMLTIVVDPLATLMANLNLFDWLQGVQSINRNEPVHLDIPLKLVEINLLQHLIF